MVFEGYESCVRKRRRYQTHIKMIPRIFPKSMKKMMLEKGDATNTEITKNGSQKETKNKQTSIKTRIKQMMEKGGSATFSLDDPCAQETHLSSKITQR